MFSGFKFVPVAGSLARMGAFDHVRRATAGRSLTRDASTIATTILSSRYAQCY